MDQYETIKNNAKIMVHHLRSRISAIVILALAATLISFQNCSDARLTTLKNQLSVAASGIGVSVLPPPINKASKFRLLVFLDQSHSMKYDKCPTDLDGTNPDFRGPDCTPPKGTDVGADRLKATQAWIDSLVATAAGVEDGDRFKVALVPFSGGVMERPNSKPGVPTDTQGFNFLTLRESKVYLKRLENEHNSEPHYPMAQKVMGTTAPAATLRRAESILQAEMARLYASDDLDTAVFEIVYLSDGTFKPLSEYLNTVKRLANCPTDCGGRSDPRPACYDGDDDLGWSGISPYQYCNTTLPNLFTRSYGDPSENTVSAIAAILRRIATANSKYGGGGTLNVHMVQIHPEQVPPVDKISPKPNLFGQIRNELADLKNVKFDILDQSTPPFSLQPRKSDLLTYKIARAYAVNLNAVVDNFGNLVVDSDGDGVSDIKEISLGMEPQNPRTNSRCLDTITATYGCESRKPCDPTLDDDGDGMNECDELSVASDKDLADTDQDNLFDFLEVLRSGFSPNKDESNGNKAGDGFGDHQHFTSGVHPQVPIGQVKPDYLVNFTIRQTGFERMVNANGVVSFNASYELNLKNLPLVKTLEVKGISPLKYQRKNQTRDISLAETIGPSDHDEKMNQIVFLVKVVAQESSSNSYWLIYRQDIPYNSMGLSQGINLDLSRFTQMMVIK